MAESLKLPARVWKGALDGLVAFDDAAGLGRITAPTLLIWGDRDAVVSGEEQRRLRDAIPDASLKVYPETGHSPHWERPKRVAADLATFTRPWPTAMGGIASGGQGRAGLVVRSVLLLVCVIWLIPTIGSWSPARRSSPWPSRCWSSSSCSGTSSAA